MKTKHNITIGSKIFKTQTELEKYTRTILTELGITDNVQNKNIEYFSFLHLLCKRHPNYDEKFQKFVNFQVYQPILNKKGLALNIVNNDGTTTEISWRICVSGKCKTDKALFMATLRECIYNQIKTFRDKSDLSYCEECKCSLLEKPSHIDHHEPQFLQLVEDFLELHKDIIIPTEYNKQEITFTRLFKEEDSWIGELFEEYHLHISQF
jgi:hypothetical protein